MLGSIKLWRINPNYSMEDIVGAEIRDSNSGGSPSCPFRDRKGISVTLSASRVTKVPIPSLCQQEG